MKSSYALILLPALLLGQMLSAQTPNWSEHVAPIVYKHCTGCHRPGEVAPFSLTNYQEAQSWGGMMEYVTEIRYMPPWKADPGIGVEYLGENFLTDDQIATIKAWVQGGMPQGDPALEPALPTFPGGSQVGTPDLVLSFAQTHLHPGTGVDEYRYFVLPTGLTEDKNLVALEMRPGNNSIVHHALVWADETGTAAALDAQTPEYGYLGGVGGIGQGQGNFGAQLPGYVPGARPHVFTNGIAQRVPAGADLVVQVHYAPTSTDEPDSSSFNLFFSNQPISRYVQSKIMLPSSLENGPFFIPANQTREFHGVWKVPADASMLGIAPHMHLLGTHWNVFAVTPDLDSIPLIRINDWDFNWQGGYFFKKLVRLPKDTEIHAYAGYDNTTNNPLNPNNPPNWISWGEGTADEMYYLPLLFVPYQPGDEDLVLEGGLTTATGQVFHFAKTRLYPISPNPTRGGRVKIGFTLEQASPLSLRVYDLAGRLVATLADAKTGLPGEHILDWDTSKIPDGMYAVVLQTPTGSQTQRVVVQH